MTYALELIIACNTQIYSSCIATVPDENAVANLYFAPSLLLACVCLNVNIPISRNFAVFKMEIATFYLVIGFNMNGNCQREYWVHSQRNVFDYTCIYVNYNPECISRNHFDCIILLLY